MKVLVDTSVWSLALRRKAKDLNPVEQSLVYELTELIREGGAALIGPIRQEVLSGVRDLKVFDRLRQHLQFFRDETITSEDYEQAARLNNHCRKAGVVGAHTDFLICAVAIRRRMAIFTTDIDFEHYARHLPIHLHVMRTGKT